jgi:hypothetical protein
MCPDRDFYEGGQLTIVIGTQKIMARTGVFVRVVCALEQSLSSSSTTPSKNYDLNKA